MRKLIDSFLTLGKVALKSRRVPRPMTKEGTPSSPLVIMGNGPSLAETVAIHAEALEALDTTALNFAANTDEFFRLKPRHYVLADPHFFSLGDSNVEKLWNRLAQADWNMTLHIPTGRKVPSCAGNLQDIRRFNMTPAEGSETLCRILYRKGLAMPRPRNVLIPAIMEGMRDGYREIYLVGADHTWPHTLYIDDNNRVVTVQPHFYKEDPRELDRIADAYRGIRIHDVLGSMAVAFRSYHAIRRYADSTGVRIFNATPGSLIDAFERKLLPDLG